MTIAVQYIHTYIHTYIYIYIYIYIFISFTFNYNLLVISSYAISYALNHSNHKSCIFNLIIILPLSNLTYAFGAQDNESPARSRWVAGRYIYIYIYILGWCTLPILFRWATNLYAIIVHLFDSYWYTNLSLTRILTVNIILRALKSFNTIYNSIYIHLYVNKTFSLSCNFLMQIVSQAIVSNHLRQIISNTNQYALFCQSFPRFKSFRNYSNIL